MHILVTGATGFLGRALVPELAAGGHRVRALVRDPARAAALRAGVEMRVGDLGDAASLRDVCDGVEAVAHLGPRVDGRFPTLGGRSALLPLTHMESLARALRAALESPAAAASTVNVPVWPVAVVCSAAETLRRATGAPWLPDVSARKVRARARHAPAEGSWAARLPGGLLEDVLPHPVSIAVALPGPRAAARGLRVGLDSELRLAQTAWNTVAMALGRAEPPGSPGPLVRAHYAALRAGTALPAGLRDGERVVDIARRIWPA